MTRHRLHYPTQLGASNVAECLKLGGHDVELDGFIVITDASAEQIAEVVTELRASDPAAYDWSNAE
jgi:hypothetical protein